MGMKAALERLNVALASYLDILAWSLNNATVKKENERIRLRIEEVGLLARAWSLLNNVPQRPVALRALEIEQWNELYQELREEY